jgi:hypothetical protein
MIQNGFNSLRNNLYFTSFIVLLFFICASDLFAQSPPNFSGTWTLDNAKSDASFKEYKVICNIKQTTDSILIELTFIMPDGEKVTSPSTSYTLDGKETSNEKLGGIDKKSAKWSPDKKVLTITNTRTVGSDVYGSNTSYKLSENRMVLTVQTLDINPSSGTKLLQVFNKN